MARRSAHGSVDGCWKHAIVGARVIVRFPRRRDVIGTVVGFSGHAENQPEATGYVRVWVRLARNFRRQEIGEIAYFAAWQLHPAPADLNPEFEAAEVLASLRRKGSGAAQGDRVRIGDTQGFINWINVLTFRVAVLGAEPGETSILIRKEKIERL